MQALAAFAIVAGCTTKDPSSEQSAPSVQPSASSPSAVNCARPPSRIEKDTTFYRACSPYLLKSGGIDVLHDAVLTIEAGVELRFASGDWLEISAAGTRGAKIIARGTQEQPIVLAARDAGAGSWLGLWINQGTRAGSVLSHVVIRGAGGDNEYIEPTLVHGCLTLTDVAEGAVTIEDVTLEDCANAGLVLRRSKPVIDGLRVVRSPVGALLDGVAPGSLPEDTEYEAVGARVIEGPSSRPRRSPPPPP